MLLITEIVVVDVPDKAVAYIEHYNPDSFTLPRLDQPNMKVNVTTEMIRGERFRDARGIEYVIGWSEAAKAAFHIPFDVFDDQRESIYSLQANNSYYVKKLHSFINASFLQRVRYLFTKKL